MLEDEEGGGAKPPEGVEAAGGGGRASNEGVEAGGVLLEVLEPGEVAPWDTGGPLLELGGPLCGPG